MLIGSGEERERKKGKERERKTEKERGREREMRRISMVNSCYSSFPITHEGVIALLMTWV